MSPRGLLLATAFLTRLPVPLHGTVSARDQGEAVPAWPLVGLLLGVLFWALASLAASLGWAAWPTAVLLVMLWAGITGALHLDGLADSADAWLGGQGNRERTLAIMKDPACGPAGVVALVLVLLGKTAAVATLLEQSVLLPLLIAPALGRAACTALFLRLPYVRENGLGHDAAEHLPRDTARTVLIIIALLSAWLAVWMLVAAAALFLLGERLMRQRLDGFTGDTAGALVEIVEVAALLAASLALI